MREKGSKLLDVMVYSINYVFISYALSNVSMALKSNPVLPSILPWRIFSGGSSGTLFRLRYEG